MIKAHKDALRKSRIALIQDLQPQVVVNHLVENELLSDREFEAVKAARTDQDKNELILGYIPRKGTTAFDKFVAVLKDVPGQQHLATKLLQAAQLHRSGSAPVSPTTTFGKELVPGHNVDDGSPSAQRKAAQPGVTSTGKIVTQPSDEDHPEKYAATFGFATDPDFVTRSGLKAARQMEPAPAQKAVSTKAPKAVSTESPETVSTESPKPVSTPAQIPAQTSPAVGRKDTDRVYRMTHSPCGLALIINNKHFHRRSGMKTRTGTDVDAQALEKLWSRLGFTSKIFNDLGASDIRRQVRALALHDHTNFDCVIVSLLTHGIEGQLYGSDGDLISIEELIAMFNADKAHRSLIGKPKLFFIQACRGDTFDKGVDHDVTDFCGHDETDSKLASLPAQADMLIAYATTPGYVSWRNSERGSWFVQAMEKVFSEHAGHEDLTSMMVIVNQVVATQFEASKHHKQVPSPIVRLTKKLFFQPAYARR